MGKCEKLTYLDLTLVQTNKLTFDVLKKNIDNLSHLKSVILPTGLQTDVHRVPGCRHPWQFMAILRLQLLERATQSFASGREGAANC